jgi:hypothetical protein
MKRKSATLLATLLISLSGNVFASDPCDATVKQVAQVLKKNGFEQTKFVSYKVEGEDEYRYYTLNFDHLVNYSLTLSNDSSSKCSIIELKVKN